MNHYARLRPKLSRLLLAFLVLGVSSATLSFFSTYQLLAWQKYTVWALVAVVALVGWLMPILRYSATYFDIYEDRIEVSFRLGSKAKRTVLLSQITSVSYSPVKGVMIGAIDGDDLNIRGYAYSKAIVRELQKMLGAK